VFRVHAEALDVCQVISAFCLLRVTGHDTFSAVGGRGRLDPVHRDHQRRYSVTSSSDM
jgi:hypothetical protein